MKQQCFFCTYASNNNNNSKVAVIPLFSTMRVRPLLIAIYIVSMSTGYMIFCSTLTGAFTIPNGRRQQMLQNFFINYHQQQSVQWRRSQQQQQQNNIRHYQLQHKHPFQLRLYSTLRRSQQYDVKQIEISSKDSKNGNNDNVQEAERLLWIDIGRKQLQGLYSNFLLDDWQCMAGGAIWEGYNVIVSAPTGAGKTLIGEMALHIAFQQQQYKTGIYTTPLKALSNQKYMELSNTFGRTNTGLSTGDISINKGARITVMTTEVYRNIAWRSSSTTTPNTTESTNYWNELKENAVVILDEFHYMGHPGRGGVWEESIIVSPSHTQIVGLSATLSNANDIVSWMEYVTGRRTILIDVPNSCRPVPLRYLFATKDGLYPLFREKDAGPGAPLGLLGYRGDGIPSTADLQKSNNKDNKKKRNGFQIDNNIELDDTIINGKKLPKGLQVNPALRDAAERRMDRINRTIERLKIRNNYSNDNRSKNYDYESYANKNNYSSSKKRLNAKEEQKERERLLKKEMRRAVPSMYALMIRLRQKDLLPAIFFIFSRNGCDEAARMVYRYMVGSNTNNVYQTSQSNNGWNDDDDMEYRTPITDNNPVRLPIRRNGRSTTRKSILQDRKNVATTAAAVGSEDGMIRDSNGRMFRQDSNFLSDDLILSNFDNNNINQQTMSDQFMQQRIASILNNSNSDINTSSSINLSGYWDYYATSGLLTNDQVRETAYRISIFNRDNAEIAFDDDLIEQYLFGIGSHHAGMLPAHKSFVELLFRSQLLKVVFATETLAAGINMPARTTVICSMAKRVSGGSSMALLDTSNLLQMAGRAGRRGMDTDGTCVLVATPFETHDDAAKILTDPILPISSQFSPSYALCVNLIARGEGELTVAKQLVSKSFAMWERKQAEDDMSDLLDGPQGELVSETLQATAHDNFIGTLAETFKELIDQRSSKYDIARLRDFYDVLSDLKVLKKTSKSFVGTTKMLEIETITLAYLEKELAEVREARFSLGNTDDDIIKEIYDDSEPDLLHEIDIQRSRASNTEHEVQKHPFSTIASIASTILSEISDEPSTLQIALNKARGDSSEVTIQSIVTPEELSTYAKSAVVLGRNKKKLAKSSPGLDPELLMDEVANAKEITEDTWDDFIAITKTLVAFGCLSTNSSIIGITDFDKERFELTPAGLNVGMLSFDNSLWALVAMGGAWDVTGASSELDKLDEEIEQLHDVQDELGGHIKQQISLPKAQEDTDALVSLLKRMSPSELAGYVSSFIADDSRGNGSGSSIVESFQRLTPLQQQVVQKSLNVLERLIEVQKMYSVDEATRNCNFDISHCEVVTAWAAGCSWSEAVEISGSPPGDLARILSRVLDAMRQFGALPFTPVRRQDLEKETIVELKSRGLDQEIRRLCREASRAINRYPLKDPLSFEANDEEDIDDVENQDEDAPLSEVDTTTIE